MAEFLQWTVSITTRDGVGRDAVTTFNVSQVSAQEYVDAADDAERAASTIGALVAAYLGMTDGAFVKTSVGIEVLNDPVSNPADTVLRGNKLMFHARSGGRGIVFTVPARKAAAFTQSVDELNVPLTTPAAMIAFVNAYNTSVEDMFGHDALLASAEVVD